MANNPDLVIFDCDGVLVDSEYVGIKLAISLLRKYGVDISFEEFTTEYSGLAWGDLINKVKANKHVTIPSGIHLEFSSNLIKQLQAQLTRIAGTDEVISKITTPKCICSNSSKEHVDFVLSLVGLTPLFAPNIFSAVDLGPGRAKPQPDIFLHAAQKMKARPEKTVVIEDSVHGVMAAHRAGMYVIGFTGGAHTYKGHKEKLEAAGANVVVSSMYPLPDEIARFAAEH